MSAKLQPNGPTVLQEKRPSLNQSVVGHRLAGAQKYSPCPRPTVSKWLLTAGVKKKQSQKELATTNTNNK